jgi:hydrophobe/amphiphile efflux-3 (HAE3) family protein
VRQLFVAWAGIVRRRPGRLTAAVIAVTIALAGGLSRLGFDTSQATMISPASQVYLDNMKYQRSFGGELMVVVLDGDIRRLFTTANRAALAGIERDTMATGRFHTIIGPDTAMTFADRQVDVAAKLVLAAGDPAVVAARAASADARRLARAGARSFDNPRYVEFLLFDEHGDVRAAQRGAFPDPRHALLVAHLRGNLSLDEQGRAVRDIERAVTAHPLSGIGTLVTGTAALTSEVSDKTKSEMGRSGLFSLLAMVLVLLLVFRARWRLLVLPVVAIAMVWAFGAFGYLGIPLTMVTMSGLPILVGLGVDFAIQVHARYEEEAARIAATGGDDDPLPAALTGVGPALVVALAAAAAGFLALRISPVPMVDDFAVMLAVGTGVLLVAVVVFVPLALVWRDRRGVRAPTTAARHGVVERTVGALTSSTRLRPTGVVGVALVIAVAGLAVNPRIPVETDPEKLVAADSPVLRDLGRLREVAGSSGDAGFMVEADDVMRPDVLAWMADFERRQLAARPTELVSANSIASITAQVTGSTPTPGDVRAVMAAAPPGIRDTFVDTRAGRVQMLFAAGHLTLDQLDVLYRGMTADAQATAPPGVRVVPSGLALIGIETVNAYTDGREPMTIAALGAVFLWLLLSLRSVRTALLALLPVVTAVGAASLAVHVAGLQVSLLAALSNPLVIAVCTEFSVLIIERAREEERRGVTAAQSVTAAAASIGRAFAVSGLTIAAAFAVVGMSGFPLLASFGMVVAVDVVAAMLCALVILPPVLRAAGVREPSPAPPDLRPVAVPGG